MAKSSSNGKVNILVSTYNGERYLKAQIDSILNQTYDDIHIYIRDDGSSDGTGRLLEDYSSNEMITVIHGERAGYGRSFLTLLEMSEEGEYWAYCDQDDVWMPEKLEVAVEWLGRQDSSVPCLFHSAYYETDEKLNPVTLIQAPGYEFNFPRAITECIYLGFSEVMNRPLRELVLKGDRNRLVTHDWWTELVAVKYGRINYDNRPMTYHRRLDDSVSKNSISKRVRWFLRAWKGNAEIRSCTREFERVFGFDPHDQDSVVNHWFCGKTYSLHKSLRKALYPHRWRASVSSEIIMRVLMLCGKI